MSNPGMYPISIDELMKLPTVSVNLFVQLGGSKFVMVARAGANTPSSHLEKLKEKGITYLYAKANDFQSLVVHEISVAGMTVGSKAVDNFGKLTVIEQALSSVHDQISRLGVDHQVINHAKLVVEASMTLLAGSPSLSKLIENYDKIRDGASRHAMMVSMVATMIGQGHEWVKQSTMEKLALGGMLHDVGKTKLPASIVSQPPDKLSYDELIIYRSHPEIGRQLLNTVRDVPDDVILMVYEHHELSDGTGYPRGLRDISISPLARVVSLAAAFVECVDARGGQLTQRTAKLALDELEFGRMQQFNRDAFKVLRKLINGEPVKKVG